MNEEYNGKHSYNLHLDKQIQIKLLEADEDIVTKESNLILLNLNSKNNFAISSNDTTAPNWIPGQWCSNSKNYNANSSNSNTYCSYFNQQPGRNVNSQDLCGWLVHPKVGLLKKKTENDATSKSKVNSALNNRDVLLSRTTKKGPPEFVFKHYSDSKRYIEQYREEHTYCATPKSVVKTTVSPKSFYPCEYEQMVSQDNAQSVSILPFVQNEKTITNTEQLNLPLPSSFLSINKREKQNICASFPNKFQQLYKFSKPFTKTLDNFNGYRADETETNYSKNNCFDGYLARQERSMSTPTITGVSLQKAVASKVVRPSSSSRISISNIKQTSPENGSIYDGVLTNQFMSRKIGSPSNSQPRAVDNVAAASVGERQISGLGETNKNKEISQSHLPSRQTSRILPQPHLTIICKDRGLEEESQTGSPNMAASPLSPTCHSLRATRTSTGRITGISHVYKGTSYSTALRHLNETAGPDQGTLSIEGGNCLFSKGFMGGKCRIRGQEDPVLLSHQRRVQHLIEQSRLRSRFGQMISKTDSICPKSYLEIASLRINNIPWSEEESKGILKNELADANGLSYVDNNVKSGVKETQNNKSSFECVSKINHPFAKGFNIIDNYQQGKDNEADGVSCAVRYTAPKLVDTDIFPSHIRIDYSYKALPILYGEAILSKPVESLPPSDKLASTRQKPFSGSFMADVPTKVNIGVPRLKYSAASPVAPSQSLI